MEPVELRTDDLVLRFWQPSDAAAVHRACRHPSLRRERPGPAGEWLAALQPDDPRSRELIAAVRRQARVFGGPPPTLTSCG